MGEREKCEQRSEEEEREVKNWEKLRLGEDRRANKVMEVVGEQ